MASAYLLLCADGTLYAGSTPDMERRLREHNAGKSGAKYTRGRRPVELAYREDFEDIAEARARERELKKLARAKKLELTAKWRQRTDTLSRPMKTLKFYQALVPLILSGQKTATWRLFDDKDLSEGDLVICRITETGREFAMIEILSARETTLGGLSDGDWEWHEKFESETELYETYSRYYGRPVGADSPVKVVKFAMLEKKLPQPETGAGSGDADTY